MKSSETPLMKQYNQIKSKYPDALLLFRVGDFYETFEDDAVKTSQILGIVLTKRRNGKDDSINLAGFPYHSLDMYLPKLIRAGLRVAICDQLEDPKLTKTIVKRGVTEIVTPGVTFNDNVLNKKENNFLASVKLDKKTIGISFLDVSTGEFFVAEGNIDYIDKLIQSFNPSEIIIENSNKNTFKELFNSKLYIYGIEDWIFNYETSINILKKHFSTNSMKGFGIENLDTAICCAGAAIHYVKNTQNNDLNHIQSINQIIERNYVWLDKFTIRNLELIYPSNNNGVSLLDIIDRTQTPMGSRLIKKWIIMPLVNINEINKRLNIVNSFKENKNILNKLIDILKNISDLERLASKISIKKISPKEIISLKNSLKELNFIKKTLLTFENDDVKELGLKLNLCEDIIAKIQSILIEEAPSNTNKGKFINKGVNNKLDEIFDIEENSKIHLSKMLETEILNTGITSLKIDYNNVFGYYFEVRNTHKDKIPDNWTRKQTLVSAERYISEELKIFEDKILNAEQQINIIQNEIYFELIDEITEYIEIIQNNANTIAQIDCLLSFAIIAIQNNYCMPTLDNQYSIELKNSRHPVIEKCLVEGNSYIPNDIFLSNDNQQIMMITGPNMAGKSAILRQTALICIMAQMGSFVPAKEAKIGFVDKIFTRVGASDNISSGESTFMVEMNETASILNNLSNRSLVLLDEIGRGTSTFDGISIAWAIAEYLHEYPNKKAKTLFATHYHELNDMEKEFERIKNYNVSVKEMDKNIIFLRKLKKGGSEHSFGIHVAKMAGIPQFVVEKSNDILKKLEARQIKVNTKEKPYQLNLYNYEDPILTELKNILLNTDLDTLTPIESLMKMNEMKRKLQS